MAAAKFLVREWSISHERSSAPGARPVEAGSSPERLFADEVGGQICACPQRNLSAVRAEVQRIAKFGSCCTFALWRWTVDQKWRRVQHAQSLVKSFFDDENVAKACEIIDTDEKVTLDDGAPREVVTSDAFMIQAFSIFLKKRSGDEGLPSNDIIVRKETNTPDENYVRWVFDDFFGGLADFQSAIESGLIKLRDISPYLEYMVKELSGNGNIRSKKFADQLHAYLKYFGYDRVLKLARNMGYPIE